MVTASTSSVTAQPSVTKFARINFFGGPGSGKSTLAHYTMWFLKSLGVQAEFVSEWVKPLTHYPEFVLEPAIHQPMISGMQWISEYRILDTGVLAVSESPILLGAVYDDSSVGCGRWLELWNSVEERWPSLNFVMKRRLDDVYAPQGRWETEEQAREVDDKLLELLDESGVTHHRLDRENVGILKHILRRELEL